MIEISRRNLLQTGFVAASALRLSRAEATAGQRLVRPQDDRLRLGCCYYPEQWDETRWAADAQEMARRGISRVRIGEFAWTLMEPEEGVYDWAWLDRAIETLGKAGLGVVLGTPTATPPIWLVERYPDILPVSRDGDVRHSGSRRYYSFASLTYRRECVRIATAMAERYGNNESIVGWQIDNEYGCHDTTYSYGPVDRNAFVTWLKARYKTIERLNTAWGTVVWSQQLPSFESIDVPRTTPTDHPPAMLLDFRRFCSDQVLAFHQAQVNAIRPRSPSRFITHNFMANFTEFDEYQIGDAVDFASWDSYPLGVAAGRAENRWDRTGIPDITGWNHDLMHAVNPAPFWVMEQQPGPVNWARYNPVPMPGMVRLWIWEAFAYGASTVSHFRWRQGQIGPEQMHSGLNRADGSISAGGAEAAQVGRELSLLSSLPAKSRGDVALVFDFQTVWTTAIQPTGVDQSSLDHAQGWYSALRRLALEVDIVRPDDSLEGYRLVVIPSVSVISDRLLLSLGAVDGLLVIGPRSGAKTPDFSIPEALPPGRLQALLPIKITQVSSIREGSTFTARGSGIAGKAIRWREWIETSLPVLARYEDESAAVVGSSRAWYVGCEGDEAFNRSLMDAATSQVGLRTISLPDHIRLKRRGDVRFAFNYGPAPWVIPTAPSDIILGKREVAPYDLSAWRVT